VLGPPDVSGGPDTTTMAPAPGALDSPCEVDTDCPLAGMHCESERATGLPHGACNIACTESSQCPTGSMCMEGSCVTPCDSDAACHDGWSCGVRAGGRICLGFCTSNADCSATHTCNVYTGLCTPTAVDRSSNGELCDQSSDCRGFCDPQRYQCTSFCDLDRGGFCPDGTLCIDSDDGPSMGRCYQPCQTNDDCPFGGPERTCAYDANSGSYVCIVPQ
jgi:hypothetical protein